MKKLNPVFFIGGIVAGLFFAIPIISIGSACAGTFENNVLIIPFVLASAIIFSSIQYFFLRKKFQTLKNFYLCATFISLASLILLINIFLTVGKTAIISIMSDLENSNSYIASSILLYSFIALCIFAFLIIYASITRQKSEYVSYISQEVKKIAENGEVIHIEEKGSDELTVLSKCINQMNDDLQNNRKKQRLAEEQKNELISNVSHDLRSPLTSIIGYIQLLEEYGEHDSKKFREYIEVIDRRLGGLSKLINELFELTKMDSPNFRLKMTDGDITVFAKQFGYEMTVLLKHSNLNLISRIDNGEFISSVDFEALARVMNNLFSNVIKYAVEGTEVLFESHIYDDKISISLSNTVKDSDKINTDTMFDRFYRDDKARADTDSTGLGLAIAKKIVELHGGDISVDIDESILTMRIQLYRIMRKK